MRTTAAAALAAGLLLTGAAACGTDAGPATDPGTPPSDPGVLVLQVHEMPSGSRPWERGLLPRFSLYGGGRVIVPDGSSGALRSAREYRLSGDDYRRLVNHAYAQGLDRGGSYEYDDETDASLLVVTLRTPDGIRTTRVTAPGAGGGGDRGRVLSFVRLLPQAPPTTGAYRPAAVAVLATGGVDGGNAGPRPWPLHPLGTGRRTREGLCRVVTGDDLDRALRLARDTRQEDSRWSSAGTTFAVSFRPLLPDEHGCADLDRH